MLIGLRKIWTTAGFAEEPHPYDSRGEQPLFNHEKLDVYQVSLSFIRWFTTETVTSELSARSFRQLDEAATSLVLNVAEGNGRYAELDHRRFLGIAEMSAVKAAAYLDVLTKRNRLALGEGKKLLGRVVAMLRKM